MKKPPVRRSDGELQRKISAMRAYLDSAYRLLAEITETIANQWKQRKKDRTK